MKKATKRGASLISSLLVLGAAAVAVPATAVLAVRPVSKDEDMEALQQFNIPVPRSTVSAFRRLASRQGKTMSQWALDELNAAVKRNLDELRKTFEEETERARREMELLEAKFSAPEPEPTGDSQSGKSSDASTKKLPRRRVST